MIDPTLLRQLGWRDELISEVNRVAASIDRSAVKSHISTCRWSQSFNLELARAEWGGNRKQEYVRPQQLDLEIRELPLPATGGRLSYWQQMGEWMMGGEYAA